MTLIKTFELEVEIVDSKCIWRQIKGAFVACHNVFESLFPQISGQVRCTVNIYTEEVPGSKLLRIYKTIPHDYGDTSDYYDLEGITGEEGNVYYGLKWILEELYEDMGIKEAWVEVVV